MDRIIFKPSTDFLLDYLQSVMAQNQGKSFLQLPVYSHKTFFPWQFLKSVRASSIVLLLWASCEKEHVISLANILSEQIVCTSGLAMAPLSLMLPSLSFRRLLSFPHALDAVYSPKASSRFENKVGFTVCFIFPFFFFLECVFFFFSQVIGIGKTKNMQQLCQKPEAQKIRASSTENPP